ELEKCRVVEDDSGGRVEIQIQIHRNKRRKYIARLAGKRAGIGIELDAVAGVYRGLSIPDRIPRETDPGSEIVSVGGIDSPPSTHKLLPTLKRLIEGPISSPYNLLELRAAGRLQVAELIRCQAKGLFDTIVGFVWNRLKLI